MQFNQAPQDAEVGTSLQIRVLEIANNTVTTCSARKMTKSKGRPFESRSVVQIASPF